MSILAADAALINLGLTGFADPPRALGTSVLQLDWRPPADGDRDLGLLLARLEDDADDPIGRQVAQANAAALERLLAAHPMLVDVRPAGEVIPALRDSSTILHSGPLIDWASMCGPHRGAIIGDMLCEGR